VGGDSRRGDVQRALGKNLRQARERAGLTQEVVAERSGVHPTEVSRIESGKRDPRIATVEALAEAVGVSVSDLLVR
jgi:transcriptional regulator with XRE-family HTH domain